MIPIPLVIAILCAAFLAGALFAGLRRSRRTRLLETAVDDLELQVGAVNEQLTHDPQRAGIDMGKRYAINQVQTTLDRLRQEVPKS